MFSERKAVLESVSVAGMWSWSTIVHMHTICTGLTYPCIIARLLISVMHCRHQCITDTQTCEQYLAQGCAATDMQTDMVCF